jgi:hypothetical protein
MSIRRRTVLISSWAAAALIVQILLQSMHACQPSQIDHWQMPPMNFKGIYEEAQLPMPLLVHCAIQGIRTCKSGFSLLRLQLGFESRDHVVSNDNLFFGDWMVAVNLEKIISTRCPV